VRIRLVAAILLCALALPAGAHVIPSVNENNRYLRLAVLGDRVRLAYTLYIGEVPGNQARHRLDSNHDGIVDEHEADAYGRDLGQTIQRSLKIVLDDAPATVRWAEIHVGMGTPDANAGSFSVDLIAWLCVPDAKRLEHALHLNDFFRVPLPGETEIMVEESPGVTVTRSIVDEHSSHSRLTMFWRGDRGYLRRHGLDLDFRVDPSVAVIESPEACARAAAGTQEGSRARGPRPTGRRLALLAALAALAMLAAILWARRYRKTKG